MPRSQRKSLSKSFIALAFMAALATTASAETHSTDHQGMQHGQQGHGTMGLMGSGDEGVASLAFRGANMKMHRDMAIEYSGDPDVDFVKGMMPHHQGAIDMAKIVLVFGKNPEVKKLAQEIIAAQEKEIAWMKEWLAKNAK